MVMTLALIVSAIKVRSLKQWVARVGLCAAREPNVLTFHTGYDL